MHSRGTPRQTTPCGQRAHPPYLCRSDNWGTLGNLAAWKERLLDYNVCSNNFFLLHLSKLLALSAVDELSESWDPFLTPDIQYNEPEGVAPSNHIISHTSPSSAISQTGPSLPNCTDVFVRDESNGAQDVYVRNGTASPNNLATTSYFQQPPPVQNIISLGDQNPSTVIGSQPPGAFSLLEFILRSGRKDGESSDTKNNPDHKEDAKTMRIRVMNHYRQYMEEHKVLKMFGKRAKNKVASLSTLNASDGRRRQLAKYDCLIKGCESHFTRKANLESEFISYFKKKKKEKKRKARAYRIADHLKSHLGMTDSICPRCNKGFTTSLQRHMGRCDSGVKEDKKRKSFLDLVRLENF